MVRTAAIAALVLLAGCGNAGRLYSESEIHDMAADEASEQVAPLIARIDELETKLSDLDEAQGKTRDFALSIYDAHESMRKTFNRNVALDNERAVAAMTARGACGQEWAQTEAGQSYVKNKACTTKDLK